MGCTPRNQIFVFANLVRDPLPNRLNGSGRQVELHGYLFRGVLRKQLGNLTLATRQTFDDCIPGRTNPNDSQIVARYLVPSCFDHPFAGEDRRVEMVANRTFGLTDDRKSESNHCDAGILGRNPIPRVTADHFRSVEARRIGVIVPQNYAIRTMQSESCT